jgi:hypothetical protein
MFVNNCYGLLIIQRQVTCRRGLTTATDVVQLLKVKVCTHRIRLSDTDSHDEVTGSPCRSRQSCTEIQRGIRKELWNNLAPALQTSSITCKPGKF